MTFSSLTLIILLFFQSQNSQLLAQKLNELGERSQKCENLKADDFIFRVSKTLAVETQNFFEKDQLTQLLAPYPNCFRVGTEVRLELEETEMSYLGRSFVSSIKVMNRNELVKSQNLIYSTQAIRDYLSSQSSEQFSLLTVNISEKIQESFVNENYKRLPNCFSSFDDWEGVTFSNEAESLTQIKDIQSGKLSALAWNGTLNCYKVGTKAEIMVQGGRPKDLGFIEPKELHLVHLSNISEKHASLLGEKLEDLKKRLTEKKEVDGGYVSIVVFGYVAPSPKPENLEEEDLADRSHRVNNP